MIGDGGKRREGVPDSGAFELHEDFAFAWVLDWDIVSYH